MYYALYTYYNSKDIMGGNEISLETAQQQMLKAHGVHKNIDPMTHYVEKAMEKTYNCIKNQQNMTIVMIHILIYFTSFTII